jgi:hypothetical protein
METSLFSRITGTGIIDGRRSGRSLTVLILACFVFTAACADCFTRADEQTSNGPFKAAPGRFEPVIEGDGYEIVDKTPAASPARPEGREQTPSDAEGSSTTGDDDRDGLTWFVDDEFSLTGWLFGHHGTTKVVADMPAICPDPCDCPTWIGQIDALMLWMGNIPSRPLYIDTTSGATAIDANQLTPGLSAAPRYSIIYNRDQCRSIEVNYFSIWGFDARRQVGPVVNDQGDGALGLNVAGLDLTAIAFAQAETSASIQSFEVNVRKVEWEWVRWITGFRWVELGQNLILTDVAYVAEPPQVLGDQLEVNTLNNLYGWQWGADAMLWNNGGRVRVNGIGKAGVYYNHQALQNTRYAQFDEAGQIISSTAVAADKDTVSFFGEAGVTASVAITNWLSWRAGYTVFWIEGIATPANQLSTTVIDPAQASSATTSPYGGAFLHGVNTGLEARW